MYEEKQKNEKQKKENRFLKKIKKNKEAKVKKEKVVKEKPNEPKKILGIKADWVSILIKFAIFLIVAFIIIFVVTKIRQSSFKNTFTNNMEKMKEVAYTYYKVEDHRPVLLNEVVTMTLGDMEDGSLIKELKDNKNHVCSKDYSYVSLEKKSDINYELVVYLSCGGEAKSANYDVTYTTKQDVNSSNEVILYELKRTVTSNERYSCPEGYLASGRYCVRTNHSVVVDAVPKYKVTPEKNVPANYKSSDSLYEYTDPIVVTSSLGLRCSSGYTLENNKCVKRVNPSYKTSTDYSCPNGGTPTGSRCLFTAYTNYSNEIPYCKQGRLVNHDECYVTKAYSVKCITGKKDSIRNACYTTYTASKELSDWLFDSKVTYSENKTLKDTDRVSYEIDEYLDHGKIRYKKYIRKYVKTCDDDDVLSGNLCKHYDQDYEQKYCSGNYVLSKDGKECYTYKDASYKKTSGTYSCPLGYSKKGSGSSATCYKYENAMKTTSKIPYCSSGYDLADDNQCVKTMEPVVEDEKQSYSCPEGYLQRGSGSNTVCYRKTNSDSYYYCSNKNATLDGTRCITPSKTTFIAYSCPYGYKNSGNKCIKNDVKETILATENDTAISKEETLWSKTKDVDGWTWTGNTKVA